MTPSESFSRDRRRYQGQTQLEYRDVVSPVAELATHIASGSTLPQERYRTEPPALCGLDKLREDLVALEPVLERSPQQAEVTRAVLVREDDARRAAR